MGSPGEAKRLFPALEAVPDIRRAHTRLMAEVMLAQTQGERVPFAATRIAEQVMHTLARG